MSGRTITHDLNKLEAQLDNLEEVLGPILENVPHLASQLPLLDRAKLFSLLNYAAGTVLFSTVKVTDDKNALKHPAYSVELKRVQQYFKKIDAAENPPKPRNAVVDTEAATRMIKAGLSDDPVVKNRLAEKIAKEKAKAFLQDLAKRPADEQLEKPGKKQKKEGSRRSFQGKTS